MYLIGKAVIRLPGMPEYRHPLRFDKKEKIECRRLHMSLAQHHVNLTAVVGLVIEEMAERDGGRFLALFLPAVGVIQNLIEKRRLQYCEEGFNFRVIFLSR